MRLTDETITIFNHLLDEETGLDVWKPTLVHGVSYFADVASTIDDGLKAAAKITIRIPEEAGSAYVEPYDYRGEGFTLRNGDLIVRGETEGTLSELRETHRVDTILAVTDNRRAPRGKHWKVVCA